MLDTVKEQDHRQSGGALRPFPDGQDIETILTLATRAPSIDNTQPWRWRVDRTSLHLYTDPGMQLPTPTQTGGT